MDIGPKRDLLGDLAAAVKKQTSPQTGKTLKFGVYHSLYEWYSPLYQADKASGFKTQHFVDTKSVAELYDLVQKYEPELIWSDGEWDADSDYWKAREFLHWYATNSTVADTAVWNDRWGSETLCKNGAFLTCSDRYNPDSLQARKYENAFTIDTTSWGWNRNSNVANYLTVKDLIHTLVQVVAFNGNVLINVGPGPDGTISPIFMDRLLGMGKWLDVNGEAIYGTRPWDVCQNETDSSVFYTKKDERLYAHFTRWPADNTLVLQYPVATENTQVSFLGLDDRMGVEWRVHGAQDSMPSSTQRHLSNAGIRMTLPALTPDILPCEHAWVIALTGLANV
jgi:alpha-L-fucosidase